MSECSPQPRIEYSKLYSVFAVVVNHLWFGTFRQMQWSDGRCFGLRIAHLDFSASVVCCLSFAFLPLANRCEAEHLRVGCDEWKEWKVRHAMRKTWLWNMSRRMCRPISCTTDKNVHTLLIILSLTLSGRRSSALNVKTSKFVSVSPPSASVYWTQYSRNHREQMVAKQKQTSERERHRANGRKRVRREGTRVQRFPLKLWRWTADVCRQEISRLQQLVGDQIWVDCVDDLLQCWNMLETRGTKTKITSQKEEKYFF